MKTSSVLFFAIFSIAFFSGFSQKSGYQNAMQNAMQEMETAQTVADHKMVASQFQRIADAEPEEWLPAYYAGLSWANASWNSKLTLEEKDALLAEAEKWVKKATEIAPQEVEITVLDGYIKMAQLSADPASRGQSMSGLVMQTFGKALKMDSENPRALAMMARMEFGTAQFFGSSTEKACGMARASLPLFENETKSGLLPTWGKETAEEMISQCGE